LRTSRVPRVLQIALALAAASQACAARDCFDEAAAYHGVSAAVLRAIDKLESNLRADAVSRNRNGSQDIGMMQINSIHLKELDRWGVGVAQLGDACVNIYVAAWHYRRQIDRWGNTWLAVGTYHSATPVHRDAYVRRVRQVLAGWLRQGDLPRLAALAGNVKSSGE